jgi:hypothetical protein
MIIIIIMRGSLVEVGDGAGNGRWGKITSTIHQETTEGNGRK